jgi:hypothetical protein
VLAEYWEEQKNHELMMWKWLPMKISFSRPEFRNLKGRMAERLVQCFIENSVIPTLLQSWDTAILVRCAWFGDEIEQNKNVPSHEKIFWKHEEKFFIHNGFCPTRKFLNRFKQLTELLKNVPDGFLVKIKKTTEFKTLKQALEDFQLSEASSWTEWGYTFHRCEHRDDEMLAVVDGEIDVVEVKSDKSNIPPHQEESYKSVLKEGFRLRFYHVDMSSMAENEFEIQEKLLTKPNELATFPFE